MRLLPERTLIVAALAAEYSPPRTAVAPQVCITGVGPTNAARKLSDCLARKKRDTPDIDTVVNIGSAGSHTFPKLRLLNPTEFYRLDHSIYESKGAIYRRNFEQGLALQTGTPVPGYIQTSLFTADRAVRLPGDLPLIDMEGYELAKVCHEFGMPFLCLKFVSDAADADVSTDWRQTLKAGRQLLTDSLTGLFAG